MNTKSGSQLRKSGSISYTRVRAFTGKPCKVGFRSKQFGLHSLRAGGASAAANAGVPDRLFKRHGRWNAEDGYVKDSLESRLSVSKRIGI